MVGGQVKNIITEDAIEQALLQRLQHLYGFDVLVCHTSKPDDLNDGSGRGDKRDVVLADRLKAACERLNPGVPAATLDEVVSRVMDRRGAMSPLAANRELDGLIRDGVPVVFEDAEGTKQQQRVRLIDFDAFGATLGAALDDGQPDRETVGGGCGDDWQQTPDQ